jgi:hypothetical protein
MDLSGKLGKKKTIASVTPKPNPLAKTGPSALGRFIFMDFCQQAKVYLVIALFTLMYYVYTDQDYIWVALKAVLFIAWGFAINKLCLKNLKAIAWIMAIIPPFVFLLFTLKVSPAIPNAPQPIKMANA